MPTLDLFPMNANGKKIDFLHSKFATANGEKSLSIQPLLNKLFCK